MKMTAVPDQAPNNPDKAGLKLSTSAIAPRERHDWLREVICREYAQVDIISPVHGDLSQELVIYPWENLQLSIVKSTAISLQRSTREPYLNRHDAYLMVMLLSGDEGVQEA